jgi:predicted NUDIX family NTP pyrophosphohydrolase
MLCSAGLLLFRRSAADIEILLAHPGGPFWAAKHEHAWSIPKGLVEPGEDPFGAAKREFEEELGHPPPTGEYVSLGELAGRKRIIAWAVEADFDPAAFARARDDGSPISTTEIEWPPRSGRRLVIPEIDRVQWFDTEAARTSLHKGQVPLVDRLLARVLET